MDWNSDSWLQRCERVHHLRGVSTRRGYLGLRWVGYAAWLVLRVSFRDAFFYTGSMLFILAGLNAVFSHGRGYEFWLCRAGQRAGLGGLLIAALAAVVTTAKMAVALRYLHCKSRHH